MQTRGKSLVVAVALALGALLAPAASAQLPAPRLVEESDDEPLDTPDEAPLDLPAEPSRDPGPLPAAPAAPRPDVEAVRQRAGAAPAAPRPPAPAAAVPGPARAASAPGLAPAGAGAGEPPSGAADLARRIVPVSTSYARLLSHWAQRRAAQRAADPIAAERAEKALLAARRELAVANLVPMAAVEVRESRRALRSNLTAEAVAHARTAVALAPDLPDAHLALARARFAESPGSPGRALVALRDAVAVAAREPHTVRSFYGDVFAAAFAAVFVGGLATVLLLTLRRARLFLHDFHHLPLLRGTARVQTSFLAVVLLVAPLAFRLGPVVAAAVALAAVFAYLSWSERVVGTLAVAALLALPWGAGAAARLTAWTGSLAEVVHDLEHGAVADAEAAEIAARWADRPAPAALYAALGRHHKRRGALDEALRYYRLAAAADAGAPEVQVNLGNVLFLQGDLDGAKAAYLAATDRAGADRVVLAAAHYDLSKLYLRTSDMPQSAAAREKAEREAGEFLRRYGSDDDFAANRYLVDVPVPDRKIAALAEGDGSPEAVAAWVRARLSGAVPRAGWPWAPAGLLAALWALAPALARAAPARACARCGGAVCRRCHGSAASGDQCGQCVNVFVHRGLVDARDRLRKEAQVRRHRQLVQVTTRILSIVGGGAAQIFHGAAARGALLLAGLLFVGFVLWFWRGIMAPPQPSPYALAGKLAVAVPAGVALWAFAIRDAFKRTE